MFFSTGIVWALVDGEIEAAANAENSSGRFVMLKATDTVGHKKKVETDKANNDASDLDFASGDVSLGGAIEDHQRQSTAELCSWQAVQLQCQFGELCAEQRCQCPWNW